MARASWTHALLAGFAAVLSLTGCRKPSPGLIIYTARDSEEVAKVINLFAEKYPEYKGTVETITLGAQDALDRLRAEKANPQAGFLWGNTQQGLQQAASEGLLASSNPPARSSIDPSRKDPQRRWYAEMLLPEVIVYNHNQLKPDQAPKDWDDLITPACKGKIVIRDALASGTMRTIFSAMIYRKSAGTGAPEAGYDWLKRLDANTITYSPSPGDMYLKIDMGVGSITLWNLQDALIQSLKNKRPWSYVIPPSGVPVLLDGVGVVNNPKSLQEAEKFEGFLLDPQLQLQLARDYYQIPAVQVPDSQKPEWLTKLNLKEMPLDWDLLRQKQAEWMDYWAQNIKGKGNQ
jgi:iron(III) transport system substrate-binding protein